MKLVHQKNIAMFTCRRKLKTFLLAISPKKFYIRDSQPEGRGGVCCAIGIEKTGSNYQKNHSTASGR
jgi:hypothetical protein